MESFRLLMSLLFCNFTQLYFQCSGLLKGYLYVSLVSCGIKNGTICWKSEKFISKRAIVHSSLRCYSYRQCIDESRYCQATKKESTFLSKVHLYLKNIPLMHLSINYLVKLYSLASIVNFSISSYEEKIRRVEIRW